MVRSVSLNHDAHHLPQGLHRQLCGSVIFMEGASQEPPHNHKETHAECWGSLLCGLAPVIQFPAQGKHVGVIETHGFGLTHKVQIQKNSSWMET